MASLLRVAGRQAWAGWRRSSGYPFAPACRLLATSSLELNPLQESIALGLREYLASLPEAPPQPRIAVVGPHTSLFAATLRAVGAADGAVAAPVDCAAWQREDLLERISEMQAHMVVDTARCEATQGASKDVALRLGASWASAAELGYKGREIAVSEAADAASRGEAQEQNVSLGAGSQGCPPLFLFSSRASSVRAAYVPERVLAARIAHAIELWRFTEADTVMSLCLPADLPASVIDTVEAPLSVGAAVSLPEWDSKSPPRVWDLWAALRDEPSATVLFVPAERCRELVDAHQHLAPRLRAELAERWSKSPFRFTVAVAPQNLAPSEELANQWLEIFGCPLSWHYSCAEAGSLYVVTPAAGQRPESGADASNGLELDLVDGELRARGGCVFERYHERPKSTSEAFIGEGFCQTGHHAVVDDLSGSYLPRPLEYDKELTQKVEQNLVRGPRWEKLGMKPDWKVKKVLMRKYWYWTPKKGYKIYTVKDRQNSMYIKYTPRYKRRS